MANLKGKFQELIDQGRFDLARDLLGLAQEKAKFEPNEIEQINGKPTIFKKNGKIVEQDSNGNWQLKK